MTVVWSNRALKSLADIHHHISLDSEHAANHMIDNILKRGDQLATFPKLGREIDRYNRPGIRELMESPYRNHLSSSPHNGSGDRRLSCRTTASVGAVA